MFLLNLLQISVNELANQTVAQPVDDLTLWSLAVKGGWIMLVLGFLLIVGSYIFFDRFFAIRKSAREDNNFMNRIKDYIHDGKIDSALALCRNTENPVAKMIEKGISRLGRPLGDIQTSIENVGSHEISNLEKGLPILATVAGGAPMIGFLGTVIGMIDAFYRMSMAGNNINVSELSGGIYTAMVTTVGGLIVGIAAYFAYNFLVTRIQEVVHKLELRTTEFMDLLNEPAN